MSSDNAPALEVTESFQQGKRPDPDLCEDHFRDGDAWVVVVDGSTDKTGLRFNGRTGGWAAAELVADVVAAAPVGVDSYALVDAINAEYDRRLGPDLVDVPVHLRPSAVFVAVEKATGRVVRVGDAQFAPVEHLPRDLDQRGVDAVAAAVRSAHLRLLLTAGADPGVIARDDPGRQMVMPLLLARAHARNVVDAPDDLRHAVIDGRPVPRDLIEVYSVLPEVTSLVLATDGYPRVFSTLEETEAYLAADVSNDPLRIGRHAGTKAHDPANASYDDRTWVRLDRTVV